MTTKKTQTKPNQPLTAPRPERSGIPKPTKNQNPSLTEPNQQCNDNEGSPRGGGGGGGKDQPVLRGFLDPRDPLSADDAHYPHLKTNHFFTSLFEKK